MANKVKVAGTWKSAIPSVNVNGQWKAAHSCWTKISGVWKKTFAAAGSLNTTYLETVPAAYFDSKGGFGGNTPNDSITLPDGTIIVVGGFTSYKFKTIAKAIAKIDSNGNLDAAFNSLMGTGANGAIYQIVRQPDGKIILAGVFAGFNTTTAVNGIIRLNADYSVDSTFVSNIGTGTNAGGTINNVELQSDGSIILYGYFTSFNGTAVAGKLIKLSPAGVLDTTFNTTIGTGIPYTKTATILVQADNKIIVAGAFTTFNGAASPRIIRLTSTGALDSAFVTAIGAGPDFTVDGLAIQPSTQNILVAGSWTLWSGVARQTIVRLSPAGAIDTAFQANTGTTHTFYVSKMFVQPDESVIFFGTITMMNGISMNRFGRMSSEGVIDSAYAANLGGGVSNSANTVERLSDGSIFAMGQSGIDNFYAGYINKVSPTGVVTKYRFGYTIPKVAVDSSGNVFVASLGSFNNTGVSRLAKLSSTGIIDTTFIANLGAVDANVLDIKPLVDNTILIAGQFSTIKGVASPTIAKLSSTGILDTTFSTNIGTGGNSAVQALAVNSNGSIILVGYFALFNGVTVNRIVKLSSTGVPDSAFTTQTGTGSNNTLMTVAVQSDGKILTGGSVTSFNSVSVGRLLRLNANGSLDTAFNTALGTGITAGGPNAMAVQSDGKILVGGSLTVFNGATVGRLIRLNSDGTPDSTFISNIGTGPNSTIMRILIGQNNKIYAAGYFSSWNGSPVTGVVRLNSDGTVDTTFSLTVAGDGFNGTVYDADISTDENSLFVAGDFMNFNGTPVNRLAQIYGIPQ